MEIFDLISHNFWITLFFSVLYIAFSGFIVFLCAPLFVIFAAIFLFSLPILVIYLTIQQCETLAFVIFGAIILFWSEIHYMKQKKKISRSEKNIVEPKNLKVNPSNEGNLIYAIGMGTTNEILADPTTNVRTRAIKLSRSPEYYQWVHHVESSSYTIGDTTYYQYREYYQKEWTKKPINESYFANGKFLKNSTLINLQPPDNWTAKKVDFGEYQLTQNQIDTLSCNEEFPIQSNDLNQLNRNLSTKSSFSDMVHVNKNQVYLGIDPKLPLIGDTKIHYKRTPPNTPLTVIGVQRGKKLQNNKKFISYFKEGLMNKDTIFKDLHYQNSKKSWIRRIIGISFIMIGFYLHYIEFKF